MTRENMLILLCVAEWVLENKRHVMSTIRQLAGTEETYLILAQELDRVDRQVFRARSLHAEATLTLVDWLIIVDFYHWKCAYCQEKPFDVMYHCIPLPSGGTTPANCVPVCYRCRNRREKKLQFHVPLPISVLHKAFYEQNSPHA